MLISQDWVTRILAASNPNWSVSAADMDSGFVRVGFETEGYEPIPETTGPLVIGQVVEIEELTQFKKPIRYCQVDVGQANGTGELQGIICGARNFRLHDFVVVSLPGAQLPGGFTIAARETYDHISNGMMCSAAELGLGAQANGIIVLGKEVADMVGEDARPVIGLSDTDFDVNITPDRGYALSARGLSREIASAFDLKFKDVADDPAVAGIDTSSVPEAQGSLLNIDLREETKAQRFGVRKVSGIDPQARTPFWMERELMLCGQRSVNVATDVTNYVMMLLGAPMHAFDADKITGDLTVRNAHEGEKFETLDHFTRELSGEDVVICDDNGIQSLAGVMGGTSSEISEQTTDVYFESAIWDPITVARTSRRHKLSSEASRRFERGVDPAIVEVALDIACALLHSIAGGTVEKGRTLVGEVAQPQAIRLRAEKPSEYAGVAYSRETVISRLEEVGCSVEAESDSVLKVTPATWRTDISMDVDLIEEVLRLEGLEDIPTVLPTPAGGRGLTPAQKRRRAIGHGLAYAGYAEVLPSPFIANDTFDVWGLAAHDARRNTVAVQNPLESDKAILATTLLPAMLEALGRNVARGRKDLALYGLQQVAFKRAESSPMPSVAQRPADEVVEELLCTLPDQPLHVATVATGKLEYEGPWGEGRDYAYADAIESARLVTRAAGLDIEVEAVQHLPWHPGRCAAIKVAGTADIVGYAGELHPQVLEAQNLPPRTCAMELNITALPLTERFPAPVLSAFPALHQDIALVVDEDIPAEKVRATVQEGAGDLIESVDLFDIFRGEQVGEGKKSLAFQLQFRAADRTLTDEEVNEHRTSAAELAKQRFGAEMRA
ncbi:phenylalanine--tRNA ligase subunit beta [Corynebacterium macginleyi]|uniref:Phenylalanine--tRNA ligase beta subunit n=1 Tax=Corynebacterium macginleyi TaxID=38290 RepID=A0ABS1Y6Y3_9CORY|nr:phenylalanine--tRNA ligase subunit beta [Corynebacterium macginleyi]MBK4160540.1 phenylalanine--tRNA ligase subunit beta [Corynebacterium macginleyi]MBK4164853.1 phenylalanine--tRNA ligase subunit beta [Corynebacterium macginleyi]MBK4175098.1 phenylalanine--tRNA ligase subunit beta [Corynebacterium macginleyi]MBK4180941.1 phenylalanine--tRNA ligase subunit beta [Corynebacterium macginleyi]MBK4183646.1 phenylalanine--tRNA ligase subunit beta [Corynebacterium macginleyi]